MTKRVRAQEGFSMIELMIAMAMTLIVAGAIFGLMTSGQSAFKREPEVSDRQQQIRTALDLIMRDLSSAGQGIITTTLGTPMWVQYFTRNLNNLGPEQFEGQNTDEIEVMGNPGGFDNEEACHYPGGSAANLRLQNSTTAVASPMVVLIFFKDPPGAWTIRNVLDVKQNKTQAGQCTKGSHEQLDMDPGKDKTGLNTPSGICEDNGFPDGLDCSVMDCSNCIPQEVSLGEIIRYRIRKGADGVPNLERWSSGTIANWASGGVPVFQVIARGVEDLQVQYVQAKDDPNVAANWQDNAPAIVSCGDPCTGGTADTAYGSLITGVRVTLSSRSDARGLQGMSKTNSATDKIALRGKLTSVISVRTALNLAAQNPNGGTWN